MIPLARTKKLLIQEVGEELIVYDEQRDTAHCLNPIAARVWYYCDGQNTVEDITKLLEEDLNIPVGEAVDLRGLVWLTLEDMEHFHLIDGYLAQPTDTPKISRRKMIKKAALVSGFAIGSLFPLIESIVAPTPLMACPDPEPCPTTTPTPGGRCDYLLGACINVNCQTTCRVITTTVNGQIRSSCVCQ